MPRHIRLRQHSRIRKPARVAGLFDFQLHEARVKEGIAKVTVDRRGLKREAASTVSQFVNTFVPQLRYWNPSVPVTLVDGKVDKAPEAAVIITHGEGDPSAAGWRAPSAAYTLSSDSCLVVASVLSAPGPALCLSCSSERTHRGAFESLGGSALPPPAPRGIVVPLTAETLVVWPLARSFW